MVTRTALVATPNASRYLQQLCKHWSHKFEANYDAVRGEVVFPSARCGFEAGDDELHLILSIESVEDVERLEGVVAEHLQRFAFKEKLEVRWADENLGLQIESVL